LQPPHVGVADEPAGTRPGEHDGMHAWIAVDAVHQLVELVGDVEAEQAVRAAVDPHDQDGSAVLDLESALVLLGHGCLLSVVISPGGDIAVGAVALTQGTRWEFQVNH
jgi:hypothetical protein